MGQVNLLPPDILQGQRYRRLTLTVRPHRTSRTSRGAGRAGEGFKMPGPDRQFTLTIDGEWVAQRRIRIYAREEES